LYYYTAKADSSYAKTPVSEEVSGIKYVNGTQYLVMKDSGRLVSLSTITGIN
jgi:flagellar basal-body rod modification protein FlgD